MQATYTTGTEGGAGVAIPVVAGSDASASGVSWGAIFAGAAGAAALSLILLILGTGLGFAAVSPFSGEGVGATTFGVTTIAWLTFVQLAASGVGGYLAGRLRTRWVSTHADEVYFRDTAHGFLAWAVATLVTAATLTTAVGAIVGAGAQAAGSVADGVASVAGTATAAAAPAAMGQMSARGDSSGNASPMGYYVDRLFRTAPQSTAAPANGASGASGTSMGSNGMSSPPAANSGSNAASAAEAVRIFASSMDTGTLAQDDVSYLGQMVAQRTGMSQADAEKRVTDTFNAMKARVDQAKATARDAAEKARKASAYAALWLFVSLLIGAFVASLCATYGGRRRDLV